MGRLVIGECAHGPGPVEIDAECERCGAPWWGCTSIPREAGGTWEHLCGECFVHLAHEFYGAAE